MKNHKIVLKSPVFIIAGILCIVLVAAAILFAVNRDGAEQASKEPAAVKGMLLVSSAGQSALQEDSVESLEAEKLEPIEESGGNRDTAAGNKSQSGSASSAPEKESKYVSIATLKANIIGDLYADPANINFLEFKLDEAQDTPVYHVVAESANGYTKYYYTMNAKTGLCRDRVHYNADNRMDEEKIGWQYEVGDSAEEKPYNKYWEMGFEPSGQAFYEGIPIIPWDEEEAAE